MSPELRAMMAEQEWWNQRIKLELDLLAMVLWCDNALVNGAGKLPLAPIFSEEDK